MQASLIGSLDKEVSYARQEILASVLARDYVPALIKPNPRSVDRGLMRSLNAQHVPDTNSVDSPFYCGDGESNG